jgi:hypothetical protein
MAVGYGSPPWFALLIAAMDDLRRIEETPLPPLEGLAAETLVLASSRSCCSSRCRPTATRVSKARPRQLVLVPFTGLVTTVPLLLFAYSARRIRLAMRLAPVLGAHDQPGARCGRLRRVDAWAHAGFAGLDRFALHSTIDGLQASRAPVGAPPPVETRSPSRSRADSRRRPSARISKSSPEAAGNEGRAHVSTQDSRSRLRPWIFGIARLVVILGITAVVSGESSEEFPPRERREGDALIPDGNGGRGRASARSSITSPKCRTTSSPSATQRGARIGRSKATESDVDLSERRWSSGDPGQR